MTHPDETIYVVVLSPSQRMALLDLIAFVMSGTGRDVFVDVGRGIETTTEQLLKRVLHAPDYRLQRMGMAALDDAGTPDAPP